jgi:hypothetical protein
VVGRRGEAPLDPPYTIRFLHEHAHAKPWTWHPTRATVTLFPGPSVNEGRAQWLNKNSVLFSSTQNTSARAFSLSPLGPPRST